MLARCPICKFSVFHSVRLQDLIYQPVSVCHKKRFKRRPLFAHQDSTSLILQPPNCDVMKPNRQDVVTRSSPRRNALQQPRDATFRSQTHKKHGIREHFINAPNEPSMRHVLSSEAKLQESRRMPSTRSEAIRIKRAQIAYSDL